MIKNGLRWCNAPKEYGPYKTLYNRFVRWSRMGVFEKTFMTLAQNNHEYTQIMIDATHLKAHTEQQQAYIKKGSSQSHWQNQRWVEQ